MSEMSIREVKAEKRALEEVIGKAVNDFNKKTGLKVDGISVSHSTDISGRIAFHYATVDAVLD